MTTTTSKRLFYVAPFAVNGEFFGVATWDMANLSPKWLTICQDLLSTREPCFAAPLPTPLQGITIRFTSARESALATYYYRSTVFAMSALLSGAKPVAEQKLLSMFVHSARNLDIVRASQKMPEPFAEIFAIVERPLHVVIAFGGADDNGAAAEFGTHLAAAFLYQPKRLT